MSKRDEQEGIKGAEQSLRALGDTLRRAAQNADALDLKPEAKAWLLDQFDQTKPRSVQPMTDETLSYAREIVIQQAEVELARPSSGKTRHAETEQRRRKSKQEGGDLPPH